METFLEHVKNGLSQQPKKLSSRFFYDSRGDELFQQIMRHEAYYLPASELQIIQTKSRLIAKDISAVHKAIQVVELGAGDGSKTKYFLKQLKPFFDTLDYNALDISNNILNENREQIEPFVKGLQWSGIPGNYFRTYKTIAPGKKGRLVLFLGANVGNYTKEGALELFEFIKSQLRPNDFILMSFDLVKNPRKIIKAYDDNQGITKAFNLNLLERMNSELGANFEVSAFDHFPFYNPMSGLTSSQLISLKKQTVRFSEGFEVHFDAYEAIHTEISKKYRISEIDALAEE
uniref:L-histidine N(alpha)-methyltransferase n=1 Tax=uncultured Planktosalinus sp. TaxID=1810935 RepID=UPI0030D6DAA8